MCGRYTLAEPNDIFDRFEVERGNFDLKPNYNTAPSMEMPVITSDHTLQIMSWGFIPSWEKGENPKFKPINARDDSVAVKPMFKKAFETKRCIVPATGFYEWEKTDKGKVPYFIHLKNNELFGFAGLYSTWTSPKGVEVLSYLIITTKPNELMKPIHDRMPVILKKEDEDDWLNPDNTESSKLIPFLKSYDEKLMEAYEVSRRVNNIGENDEKLLVETI